MKIDKWLYFGCHDGPGHYVWEQGMYRAHTSEARRLSSLDGMLPPQDDATQGVATFTRLPGLGLSVIAWWDYSVDKRGKSNSAVFAPSLTIAPADMLAEAAHKFPTVFGRQPALALAT